MASVFVNHVVGDLTVGKPEMREFSEADAVEAAIRAVADSAEGEIAVWRRRPTDAAAPSPGEPRTARFVGMLSSLDLVAFVARFGADQERAMQTPVSEVVAPNPSLLKEVDPGTRLIDALEMMKQGTRRLLVRKSNTWKGVSKRFSILYQGKWLNNINASSSSTSNSSGAGPSSLHEDKYCCLSREDVVRFLIGCLGALAPIPLSSISALGAVNPHYSHIEASALALEATLKLPQDPCAIAVVETQSDGSHKMIGEISAYKLWRCDYLSTAWAMANLSAGQFVMGADDEDTEDAGIEGSSRPGKFGSRSVGFFSSQVKGGLRSLRRGMYRGRSAPLTCKHTSSLAAVMAQMLSHRATHVWVMENEDVLVGVVSYSDILFAVTKNHPMGFALQAS